nr:hypothetical protein [Tanacetum cinerariifolium]
MLAPSGGGLILYQAYGNLYAMTGPNGRSGGLTEGRLGERCGGNGGSMSGVGEGKVDLMGGMGGGLLAIRSMVSNDGRGRGGLVVEGGSSSRESRKA